MLFFKESVLLEIVDKTVFELFDAGETVAFDLWVWAATSANKRTLDLLLLLLLRLSRWRKSRTTDKLRKYLVE